MKGRPRILLIDDEPDFRYALQTYLISAGYEVTAVGSGQEGLDVLGRQTVELILLDMLMPGKGGIATYQEIRLNPTTASTPVILLTAIANQQHWEPMPNATDDHAFVMGKPYDHAVLLDRISQLLGKAASGGGTKGA
jgi:CheY-like chemotaxis protein